MSFSAANEDKEPFSLSPAEHLIDRELSWLAFNRRVLELAADGRIPLLERLFFLGIFSSNLDEFYMKRIGGLRRQIKAGVSRVNKFGRSPQEEIEKIYSEVNPDLDRAFQIYTRLLVPALESQGIHLRRYSALSAEQKQLADAYFKRSVFPLLTPLAVDSGHPFPIISNLSTSLGVALRHPDAEELLFARVKISHVQPQWIQLSGAEDEYFYVSLESLVEANLDMLFPGLEIESVMPFRVTRNAGLEVSSDDDADDLLELVEEELRQRRFAEVVRLQLGVAHDPWIKDFLLENLDITAHDIQTMPSLLFTFADLGEVLKAPMPELRYPAWTPLADPEVSEEPSLFARIRYKDVLVHHPFESFHSSVERFLREAVEDPKVQSIKMTVYRVGDTTPMIPLLVRAAEYGKSVVCLVEVKARFDEERNIQWAYTLEDAGVHVVYGIPGLKTHAKTLVVVREEADGLRAYAHIGTGNYHSHTSSLYTDMGVFTCRPDITGELLDFFNYLTGRSLKGDYQSLVVAPTMMELDILASIEGEIQAAEKGEPCGIVAQLNNLEDVHVIEALYRASMAGVPVRLTVRGICCLRPGIPGLSENIEVRSILGRFLEHTRLYHFRNGQEKPEAGEFFITSADWMGRNLHRRVELSVPIYSAQIKKYCWHVLETLLREDVYCWKMDSEGRYFPNEDASFDAQELLMEYTLERFGLEAYE